MVRHFSAYRHFPACNPTGKVVSLHRRSATPWNHLCRWSLHCREAALYGKMCVLSASLLNFFFSLSLYTGETSWYPYLVLIIIHCDSSLQHWLGSLGTPQSIAGFLGTKMLEKLWPTNECFKNYDFADICLSNVLPLNTFVKQWANEAAYINKIDCLSPFSY